MLHKFCMSLAKRTSSGTDTREIIAYGWEVFLSTAGNLLVLFSAAILIGWVPHLLVFFLCYAFLRSSTGGRHAPNHILCLVEYGLMAFGGILLSHLTVAWAPWYPLVLYAGAAVIIWLCAPYEHPNRPLSKTFARRLKTRSRASIGILLPICLALTHFAPLYGCIAATAIFFEALTSINLQRRKLL